MSLKMAKFALKALLTVTAFSLTAGFLLCGIVLEPTCPLPKGSATSSISLCESMSN